MSATIAVRRRRVLSGRGIGMPGDNSRIIEVARSLRGRVDAPVLGGIAVYLHGWPRATIDLDLYATDRQFTASQLEAAGAKWSRANREHVLDGVPIHTVTPDEAGHVVERTSIIEGVRVISFAGTLPKDLRASFKSMVDLVRSGNQARRHTRF